MPCPCAPAQAPDSAPRLPRCATRSWCGRSRRRSTGACGGWAVQAPAARAMPSHTRKALVSLSCPAKTCGSAPWRCPASPPAPAPAGSRPCARRRAVTAATPAAPVAGPTRRSRCEVAVASLHTPTSAPPLRLLGPAADPTVVAGLGVLGALVTGTGPSRCCGAEAEAEAGPQLCNQKSPPSAWMMDPTLCGGSFPGRSPGAGALMEPVRSISTHTELPLPGVTHECITLETQRHGRAGPGQVGPPAHCTHLSFLYININI